jgi:hypothetical protein
MCGGSGGFVDPGSLGVGSCHALLPLGPLDPWILVGATIPVIHSHTGCSLWAFSSAALHFQMGISQRKDQPEGGVGMQVGGYGRLLPRRPSGSRVWLRCRPGKFRP